MNGYVTTRNLVFPPDVGQPSDLAKIVTVEQAGGNLDPSLFPCPGCFAGAKLSELQGGRLALQFLLRSRELATPFNSKSLLRRRRHLPAWVMRLAFRRTRFHMQIPLALVRCEGPGKPQFGQLDQPIDLKRVDLYDPV